MQDHLRAAVDRYPESARSNKVHPISEIDAQIITEVIELCKKIKFTKAIDILNKWKKQADEDIALDLLDLNTEIGKQQGSATTEEQNDPNNGFIILPRYILTLGRRIDMFLIISYDEVDTEIENEPRFCIQINPTPPAAKTVPFYANDWLIYKTEDERNKVLVMMDLFMENNKGKFI